ncbi:hypothetical protein [Xanthomonas theicola]|uniref:hypothetical protein n=1 Tax=Xanthomonas theicola TaxID=56464 RepID=UPI0014736F65|nr:hypothetical protein [Xanthomonas theicola]QNH23494.1 hypothetical protein G4Q83_12595 [Xanthomonas theicola]
MSYYINETTDPLSIGAQQWAQVALEGGNNQGTLLQFDPLFSSIGIAVVNNGTLVGLNLPLHDSQGDAFGAADVPTVLAIAHAGTAPGSTPPCIVFGQLAYWEHSASQAYQALLQALQPSGDFVLGNSAPCIGVDNGGAPYLIQD